MTCIIAAPVGTYEFELPTGLNDVEITQVTDIKIRFSEVMHTFLAHHALVCELRIDTVRFEQYCDFNILLDFATEADAVMFKLQWES
jgi:hypothetical protein